ncbi:MAG: hypothetical protein A2Y10_15955 [Planctomycetes bacterium GWF2_41_51]|nr:MAG: hypothetical protein A2Y10_15955 [Planctomycetes bacterium GWF2_41_51]HBG27574.1 hypothetical protein [Phycisphaerales bacterium]
MKKFSFIIMTLICGWSLAVESPIGNPTVPPSSTRSGLYRSPNPIDLTGNDIITGNVRAGREFRGFVPYRADTEFGAPTATDSFAPFLRQSAPVNLGIRQPYLPQPYYVPSRTVTKITRPGSPTGLVTYSSIKNTGGTGDFTSPSYVRPPVGTEFLPEIIPSYEYTLSRPLSYTNPADLEKLVRYGLANQENQIQTTENLEKEKAEQLKTDEQIKEDESKEDSSTYTVPQPLEPAERSFEPVSPLERGKTPDQILLENKNKSVYEQMLELTGTPPEAPAEEEKEADEPKEEEKKEKSISDIDPETAEAIKGVHTSFASRANTKFNNYMKSAEEYLKQGQYYRAADAYTLASIYNPRDPLAYAGRSHALFASGEYMSSAYYLMRAITIFPSYTKVKVDLNAMIPDKDRLETRIADVTKWIEKTKSPELQFLLAYIYYQLDKPEQARNAINSSAAELQDNEAVMTLKRAIENKE